MAVLVGFRTGGIAHLKLLVYALCQAAVKKGDFSTTGGSLVTLRDSHSYADFCPCSCDGRIHSLYTTTANLELPANLALLGINKVLIPLGIQRFSG